MLNEAGEGFLNLHEIVRAARLKLPVHTWDYLIGGTETETTLRRNRQALDSVAFRPRVLRDVSKIDCSSTFLGQKTRLPVALAPIGGLESFDPGGAATGAKAAAEFGIFHIVSSVCQPGLEPAAEAAAGPKVFQLYVRGDEAWIDDHVRRAKAAGYDAFCLTVDTAVYSRRERDIARRFVKPWRTRASGLNFQSGLSWDHVKRFKDKHDLPLILKGIATAEDAATACEHGVEVVYVSNHGGRQLDHGRGSFEVLAEVVDAVAKRAKVVVDGAFCRGTDVIKGIAAGADVVGIGRLYGYGMAAGGQAGVVRMLELLEEEIVEVMGLLGVSHLDQLDRSYLHPAAPVGAPHVHSAFPHLSLDERDYR
ncbi:MAG: alpha-hydroxy-acid oxidizing protein [Alphaproteobacteria bacterium]